MSLRGIESAQPSPDELKQSLVNASPEVDMLIEEVEENVGDLDSYCDREKFMNEVELAKECLCLERAEENFHAWREMSQVTFLGSGPERQRRSAREIRTDQLIEDVWRVRANELRDAEAMGVELRKPGKLETPITSFRERLTTAQQFIESLPVKPTLWCLGGSSLEGNFEPDSDIDITALFSLEVNDTNKEIVEEEIEKRKNLDTGLIDGLIDFHPFFESSVVFQKDPKLLERMRREIEGKSQNATILREKKQAA